MRPLGHPPPPVLRPCRRPLQLLDQPCFLRLAASLCGASFPSCCCWQLLLHIISDSIFLSFSQSPPFLPAALLHILLTVAHTTTKRGWFLVFWLRSQMTSLSLRVYLFTILSLFFLTSGFGWCIACSSSSCSSSLPARLAPCHALLCFSNLSSSPLSKSNQLFTALISELK